MVSVIVPVYKVEPYLRQCVESILAQTYTDFELILVDDGSPDNCGAICDEYAQKDSRVRVVHQKNGGLSAARNAGLDIAKGEYVIFIDSDDYIAPNLVETAMAEMQTGVECVCFNYSVVTESNTKIAEQMILEDIDLRTAEKKERFIYNLLMHRIGWEAWNKLFLREAIERNKIRFDPQIKYAEDQLFSVCYFMCATKVKSVPDSLYFYVKREGSIMSEHSAINNVAIISDLSQRLFEFCRQQKNCEWAVEKFALINYLIIGNELRKLVLNLNMNRRQIRTEIMCKVDNIEFVMEQFKQLKKCRKKLAELHGKYRAARELSDVQYYIDGNYFNSRIRNRLILIHEKLFGEKQ